MVLDTETIGLDKPFCYNIGYIVYDTEREEMLAEEDYIVEQIWHNTELFHTAYYADKRNLYISNMKAKLARMEKYG